MVTSLQRAVVASTSSRTRTGCPIQHKQRKGEFETSFANGLDLSEFSTNSRCATSQSSCASAELLRLKTLEVAQQKKDKIEEAKMEGFVKRRARNLKESLACGRNAHDSILVSAIVKMHNKGDIPTTSTRGKKRIAALSNRARTRAKSKAVKKSCRIKH